MLKTHTMIHGVLIQLVTPEQLRAILLDAGEPLTRPADCRACDEWEVARGGFAPWARAGLERLMAQEKSEEK